ncbi:MAG: hypothetical protein COZ06_19060 [Armatimonadetes bacterium CG_4_10_14_3_um_filter_66_18]|nr:hypothetical protein [Armatimonadota bacterium]PIY45725.1 MAG: hypothetical protein COZ06_19060 [Armatimonadetes bacterium CG_4_10_14_3_um_filter_66_18]PIZ34660.1 MAG: hypothetical protein COY42_28170 [Armatimonadetes bacterium CG_4_10_14_0_8_um_filter_66_14]PJB63289.1 MAG: hypothetical protein CO096_22730 [Armatimonadetes bacterium CG_4_9_14_3_um_filter_66_14]NCP34830.1 hypothetical protein [Armatimonadota bacterium]
MPVSNRDRGIIRKLASQIAEIAALPVQAETVALWKALNGLKPVRPMVMIDQIPWHEMEVDGELTLQCEDGFCRGFEGRFRRTLYSWTHMRADMVVEPVVEVGKAICNTGFGIRTQEKTAVLDPRNNVVGHFYLDQLKTEADLDKIRTPEIALDEEATARVEEQARELFDGLLDVRMQGSLPSFAPWDVIVQWHGVEEMLFDLADRPEFMHGIISRLTHAMLSMLDQLEEQGLLGHSQSTIHCCGAHTDELPAPGFDPAHPRAKDLWTSGMAQIFSTVSPATHQEFELAYANRWYDRFGLVYYGCCEPLDRKVSYIRDIPHVRKVSMSPWVDQDRGAEQLAPDLVFSRKPSPAFLCVDDWDPAAVEKDLRNTVDTCARHGCPVELILKDISTVRYEPQRLWEWEDIARRVVEETA